MLPGMVELETHMHSPVTKCHDENLVPYFWRQVLKEGTLHSGCWFGGNEVGAHWSYGSVPCAWRGGWFQPILGLSNSPTFAAQLCLEPIEKLAVHICLEARVFIRWPSW